jgi:hypothetical protein
MLAFKYINMKDESDFIIVTSPDSGILDKKQYSLLKKWRINKLHKCENANKT